MVALSVSAVQVHVTSVAEEDAETCPICCESAAPLTMPCGTSACASCWNRHVKERLDRGLTDIVCMTPTCGADLESELRGVLTVETVWRRQKIAISRDPTLMVCPGAGCGDLVALRPGSRRVRCERCAGLFCADCLKSFHRLPTCSIRGSLEVAVWQVGKNTRRCPSCRTCIQKTSGCKHMRCRGCDHEFCWRCLRPWAGHRAKLCRVLTPIRSNHWALGPAPVRPITKAAIAGVAVGVAGVAVATSVVVVPAVLACKAYRRRARLQRIRRSQAQSQMLRDFRNAPNAVRRDPDTDVLLCGEPELVRRTVARVQSVPNMAVSVLEPASGTAPACLRVTLGSRHARIWWWPSASGMADVPWRRWKALLPEGLRQRSTHVFVMANGRRRSSVRAALDLRAALLETPRQWGVQLTVVDSDPAATTEARFWALESHRIRAGHPKAQQQEDPAEAQGPEPEDVAARRIQRAFAPQRPTVMQLVDVLVGSEDAGRLIGDDTLDTWSPGGRCANRSVIRPPRALSRGETVTAEHFIGYRIYRTDRIKRFR